MHTTVSPICLFTYNRIWETKQTVRALLNNPISKLSNIYIYSDGPKNKSDIGKVKDVRKYINSIRGFNKITILEHEHNKGLANSIIDGVSDIVNKYGKVIVLEDDLITSSNFLDFINQALSFYSDDNNIWSVSGYTLDLPSLPGRKDYYYGYRASSWGWGTWKNRWNSIDWDVPDYQAFNKNKILQNKFNRGGSDLCRMLEKQQNNQIDSWAIRFCYYQFKQEKLTVYPTISKIQNIGFSNEATNTAGSKKRYISKLDAGNKTEFNFEKFNDINQQLVKEFRDKFSIRARLISKINKTFEKYLI